MGGEAFDLGEVVGAEEDGGGLRWRGGVEQGFDELVAHQGIEAGERFVKQDELGAEGENAGERGLHALTAGEVFELAVEREIEAGMYEGGVVPARVEAALVAEEGGDGHPAGEFLVFGDVADADEVFPAE